jgi:hypothetical protein
MRDERLSRPVTSTRYKVLPRSRMVTRAWPAQIGGGSGSSFSSNNLLNKATQQKDDEIGIIPTKSFHQMPDEQKIAEVLIFFENNHTALKSKKH